MGGIGNVVVNTLVRIFTKKAVGKAMKSAGSMGPKKGRTKKARATGANSKAVPREKRSSIRGAAGPK